MPGFNRWLNGKNKQINRQKQMEARVFGTDSPGSYGGYEYGPSKIRWWP